MEEIAKEVERHHTKGKEVTLKMKSYKRPREGGCKTACQTELVCQGIEKKICCGGGGKNKYFFCDI